MDFQDVEDASFLFQVTPSICLKISKFQRTNRLAGISFRRKTQIYKTQNMETIILHDGRTTKGIVKELGFNGLFWCGQYIDKDNVKHFVTFHNNCWME